MEDTFFPIDLYMVMLPVDFLFTVFAFRLHVAPPKECPSGSKHIPTPSYEFCYALLLY